MQDNFKETDYLVDNESDGSSQSNVDQKRKQTEDTETKKTKSRATNVVYFVSFALSVEYGVVIATLWPYLRKVYPDVSTLFLGMTASSYNVGHFLFAFLFGIWAERRNAKEPLVFALCTIVSGCIIYAYAENVSGYMGTCMILIARTVVGMVAGADVALRTFISQTRRPEEATRAFGNLAIFSVVGFLGGPALQIVLAFLRDSDVTIDYINLHLNIYTAPAYVGILLSALSLMALLLWFKEVKREDSNLDFVQDHSASPDLVAIGTNMVLIISYQFCYTSYETLLSPILIDEFSLDNKDAILYASVMFLFGMIVILFGFDIARRLINRFDVPRIIIFGCIILLVAFVIILPWGNEYPEQQKMHVVVSGNITKTFLSLGCSLKHSWCTTTPKISMVQLILYSLMISMAFPLMYLSQFVMLYQILSPNHQGYYMAIVTSCGSVARIFGSIISTYFYDMFGPRWTFVIIDSFLIIVLAIVFITYKRIVPYDQYIKSQAHKLRT